MGSRPLDNTDKRATRGAVARAMTLALCFAFSVVWSVCRLVHPDEQRQGNSQQTGATVGKLVKVCLPTLPASLFACAKAGVFLFAFSPLRCERAHGLGFNAAVPGR
jgi:hypothetical protein